MKKLLKKFLLIYIIVFLAQYVFTPIITYASDINSEETTEEIREEVLDEIITEQKSTLNISTFIKEAEEYTKNTFDAHSAIIEFKNSTSVKSSQVETAINKIMQEI